MAEYQKTIITNAGISVLNRVLANKATMTFTRAVSSTDDLSGKTEADLRSMTSFSNIMQNGICSSYDIHNQNMVSLDLVFTNEGLGNSYLINTVGLYAKPSDSNTEVLYAIARARKDSSGNSLAEQMPAYVGSLTEFTISLFTQVGQSSSVSVSITDAGVVKSINGSIKPDANGDLALNVGGRNLLTNTRTISDVWNGDTETVDGFTVAKATQTNSGNYDPFQWSNLILKPNTDYVLTFYAKASKQTQIYSLLYSTGTDTASNAGAAPNTLTTDYQRFIVNFHTNAIPAGGTVTCLPVRLTDVGVTAWIYGVQLEEGNVATSWRPNPDDTDQAISNEATARANADASVLTQAKSYTDTAKSDLTTAMANEATARTNADNSVLSQAKSYTDTAKSDLTAAMTSADSSVLGKANAYTDFALRGVWTPTVITAAIDLNNIKACGCYMIRNGLGDTTNTPIQSAWLYVRVEGLPDRITQTVWQDINPANQWVRVYTDTKGWGNWVQITKAI